MEEEVEEVWEEVEVGGGGGAALPGNQAGLSEGLWEVRAQILHHSSTSTRKRLI